MQINILKQDGSDTGDKLDIQAELFEVEYKQGLIHQAITKYLAGGRAGTKAQKTRSEVRGGGSKPWRQKGTGRARAGTINSPIWRSGGVTFAAKTRDHAKKLNKKMYRLALRSIISELLRSERLLIIDDLNLDTYKTKAAVEVLANLSLKNALIVLHEIDDNINLAMRNIVGVEVITADQVNPVNLVRFERVVATKKVMTQLSEVLV